MLYFLLALATLKPQAGITAGSYAPAAPQPVSTSKYRKVPKFWDARNLCCNVPKIQTKRPKLKGYFVKMVQME